LGKLLSTRQKEQKGKRDGWGTFSCQDIWKQLCTETRKAGRDHAALAEIYNTAITSRCVILNEDITRIYKKVRYKPYFIDKIISLADEFQPYVDNMSLCV